MTDRAKRWLGVLLALAVGLVLAWGSARSTPRVACPDTTTVIVSTRDHRLVLCEASKTVATFPIALGRGGVGKRAEGDKKTPLGLCELGDPRPSARFGRFIPIGYPTPEQRKQGLTGTDVGIHGPDRRIRWVGAVSTWVDWTSGCVAVARDRDIEAIASFVRKVRPHVEIR